MRRPDVHELGDAAPVANQLEELGRDERDGLRVVEAEPAREALLREEACAVKEELVDVARGEVHRAVTLPHCVDEGKSDVSLRLSASSAELPLPRARRGP